MQDSLPCPMEKNRAKSRKRKSITYTRQYLNRLNFAYIPIPTHFHCVRSGLFVCAIIIISINHKNCILTLYHKSGICGELEWTLLIWLAFQIVEFVALPVPKTLDILKREISTYDIILFKAFSSLYFVVCEEARKASTVTIVFLSLDWSSEMAIKLYSLSLDTNLNLVCSFNCCTNDGSVIFLL